MNDTFPALGWTHGWTTLPHPVGLLKLDEEGQMVQCNGAKKGAEKFVTVGGGSGFLGLAEALPAQSCEQIAIRAPFTLLDSNLYWIVGADGETAINVGCKMAARPAVSKGGDGCV